MQGSSEQGSDWRALLHDESGQTMAEYATLLGVLIIAVAAVFTLFAVGVDAKLQSDLNTILSGDVARAGRARGSSMALDLPMHGA